MTVQPQAAPTARTGTAMTVIDQRRTGQGPESAGFGGRPNQSTPKPSVNRTNPATTDVQAREAWRSSGDVRMDGYTLWAFRDVFKGLVLDVRM